MPTGYTAAIADGITFDKFAMNCARAFGALVMMRDEPMDAPIPEKFEPTRYHLERVTAARTRQAELEAMTPAMTELAAEGAYRIALEHHEKYVAEKNALRDKYNTMLAQVEEWTPPTKEHEELKKFMREQIEESLRFDCTIYDESKPELMTGARWLDAEMARAKTDIAYHSKEHTKELERTSSRSEWVRALRESLR